MHRQTSKVGRRDVSFTDRTVTRLWQEIPDDENPYLAGQCRCHGYDILELAEKRSFMEVLFLLFRGELPARQEARLLETLFIAMINPGPRHPASRAAMNAAVSRTNTQHLLPIGLSVLSGSHLGGGEVLAAMRYLADNLHQAPEAAATTCLAAPRPKEGDFHPAPGFGSRFGGIDPLPAQLADILGAMPGAGATLRWGKDFAAFLRPQAMGWLSTGIAAATLCDLGFTPWAGAGLFQLMNAPGILAHGLELADKPLTSMPFLDEEHYVIAEQAKK